MLFVLKSVTFQISLLFLVGDKQTSFSPFLDILHCCWESKWNSISSWVGPSSPTIVVVWWRHHSDNQTDQLPDWWLLAIVLSPLLAVDSGVWNSLPPDIKSAQTRPVFCNRLNKLIFSLNVFPRNCTPTSLAPLISYSDLAVLVIFGTLNTILCKVM